MKYKVGIRDGYNPSTNEVLNTNGETTFSYKNYLGEDTVGDFPIPKVHVGGGMILVHWYQVNANGEPINELGQTVDGPAYAKQVQPAAYFEANGSTGLSYNTQYTVAKTDFADYNYYGSYIVNNGSHQGDAATVTLTAANSNQHAWFAYTQSFRVGHVQFAANEEDTTVYYTEHTVEQFNLTSVVTDRIPLRRRIQRCGMCNGSALCGRTECNRVHSHSRCYLLYLGSGRTFPLPEGTSAAGIMFPQPDVDVTGFYLVTPVDRLNYREVGFMVGSETLPAEQFTETYITEVRCGDHSGSYRQRLLCLQHRKSRFQQRHKRYVQCFKRYQQDPRIPCLLRHG